MNDREAVAYIGSLMDGCLRAGMYDEWNKLLEIIKVEYYNAPI